MSSLKPWFFRLPALLALALPAQAATLRLEGDRLSLRAEREPVEAVLREFARQGVRVKLDPAVSGTVTLTLNRQKAETVLDAVLKDWDYVAVWKQARGPLGPIPVLEELQVFKPGHREAARPLEAPAAPRPRIREFMAGELLVRVSTNASADAFLSLVARHGGRVADAIPALGLYKIVFPPETDIPALAAELGKQSLIAAAEPNYVYRLPPALNTPGSASGPALDIRPGRAGGQPLVAVLDTGYGIADDPLMGWLDATGGSGQPEDRHGHGTEMGLLASGRIQPLGGSGAVEAGLPVLAVRIANEGEFVAGDALMKSLQAAIDQKVRVVSLSWGSDMDSQYLKELLGRARAQGVVVVAAAGNSPTGAPIYPAAFPDVLAVAGTGPDGKPADWSNHGSFVDFAAPGYAPLPGKQNQVSVGTSVSTAYAANILGRYFQLHPEATADQAVKAVQAALSRNGWDARYGAGALDTAAIDRLLR